MKKIVTLIFTLVLTFSVLPTLSTQASQVFSDVPITHSNYKDIIFLLEKGVIEESNNFGLSTIVTREDVAVMVAKAKNLNGEQRETQFSDIPKSNSNSGYIQSAAEAGIINGYTDGKFKPNEKVTRGHMAAFIARAFKLPNGNKTFKDVKKGDTAYEAVSQLVAAGITTGFEDGTFKPGNNLTRAHIAAFLARAMNYEYEKTPSPAEIDLTPVYIPDSYLESIIRENISKPTGVITRNDMLALTHVNGEDKSKMIQDLTGLEYATNLEHLYIQQSTELLYNISSLRDLKSLTSFIMGETNNNLLQQLIKFKYLESLHIELKEKSDLTLLQGLPKLTSLAIYTKNAIENIDIAPIGKLSNLRALHLYGTSDLTILKSLTNLEDLNLHYNEISDLTPIKDLTKLTSLRLAGNKISDITPLNKLTKLKTLILADNQIQDISTLEGLTDLYYLSLENNRITDITPLSKLTDLRYLFIKGNQITDTTPLENLTKAKIR